MIANQSPAGAQSPAFKFKPTDSRTNLWSSRVWGAKWPSAGYDDQPISLPSWPPDERRHSHRGPPSTGWAGRISCRLRTCCSKAKSRRNARGRPASRSRSKPSTATTCRRASSRQSNRELDPTSSCGDELIDLVVAALGAGDLVSHVTDLDEAFSVEPRPVAARHSSTLRRPCSAGAGLALAA